MTYEPAPGRSAPGTELAEFAPMNVQAHATTQPAGYRQIEHVPVKRQEAARVDMDNGNVLPLNRTSKLPERVCVSANSFQRPA